MFSFAFWLVVWCDNFSLGVKVIVVAGATKGFWRTDCVGIDNKTSYLAIPVV